MIDFSIIFAGFGGQGILSAGKMAAEAALYEGKEVSWFPSYGPEMRGGTANCSVVIFINNTIYGMTGGQMAPTTLPGQVTQTTPFGRSPELAGYPVKVCEMLSTLTGTAYAERVAVDSVPHIKAAKKAIRKAFENQKAGKGFSIVEVLSTCPTNWGLAPLDAIKRLQDEMIPYYPLGVYKDVTESVFDNVQGGNE